MADSYRISNKSGEGGPAVPAKLLNFSNSGYAFAVAVKVAADQLGMEVDDFIRSSIGAEAMRFMAWQLYGQSILFIIYAGVILIVGLSLFRWFWFKNDKITVQERQIDGKIVKTIIPEAGPNQQEWRVVAVFCIGITVAMMTGFIIAAI